MLTLRYLTPIFYHNPLNTSHEMSFYNHLVDVVFLVWCFFSGEIWTRLIFFLCFQLFSQQKNSKILTRSRKMSKSCIINPFLLPTKKSGWESWQISPPEPTENSRQNSHFRPLDALPEKMASKNRTAWWVVWFSWRTFRITFSSLGITLWQTNIAMENHHFS